MVKTISKTVAWVRTPKRIDTVGNFTLHYEMMTLKHKKALLIRSQNKIFDFLQHIHTHTKHIIIN